MTQRNLTIITKIIAYYCAFYTVIKIFAVINGTPYYFGQLILAVLLLALAASGFYLLRRDRQNWGYAFFGIAAVSLLRYFEADLLTWLQGLLN